jgi:hypothetical protein
MSASSARTFVRVLVATSGILGVAATPAWAQSAASSRPFRGLFGGTTTAASRQALNFTVDLSEAHDDDVLSVGGPSITPDSPPMSGFYSMLTAGADYRRQGRRVQIGLNASSGLRYYDQLKTVQNVSSSLGAGVSTTLPGRIKWLVNQTVAYSPSYLYGLFPAAPAEAPGGLPASAAPSYAVNDISSYSYGTSTTFSHGVARRGSLTVGANLMRTDFVHQVAGRSDMLSYGARVEYAHGTSRNTSARVAYRFQGGDSGFGLGSTTVEHGVEIGMQSSRPLSASRRVSFTLALGPSTVTVPAVAIGELPGQAGTADRQLYRLAGSAGVQYQFGRSWQARASYNRGLEYVPGLQGPVLTGGVSTSVDGLLSRRIDLSLSGGYSDGSSALRTASTYTTYTGDARLRYALTRSWAMYVQYLYYFYDFRGTTLLPGLPQGLERNAVHAGLTLWLPVLKR